MPTFGGPAIDHEAVAQAFTLALCRKHFFDFGNEGFDLGERRRDQFSRHVAFVREIDARLDQCRGLDDLGAPVAGAIAEQALQLTQCLSALTVGVGGDEVVQTFGLGEIELAVLERTAGEFAGLRRPDLVEGGERGKQCGQHGAPAMDVKFRDVLASRAGGMRKPKHHRIVNRLPAGVAEQSASGDARRGHLAGQRGQDGTSLRSGHANDGDRAWRPA